MQQPTTDEPKPLCQTNSTATLVFQATVRTFDEAYGNSGQSIVQHLHDRLMKIAIGSSENVARPVNGQ